MAAAPVARTRTSATRMSLGPRVGRVDRGRRHGVERSPADGEPVLGRHGRHAQRQARVAAGIGPGLEDDLALTGASRSTCSRAIPGSTGTRVTVALVVGAGPCGRRDHRRRRAWRRPRRAPPPHVVGHPGDGPARFGDRRHRARRRRRSPSAAATWSCSWRSRRSVARSVARCSSTRAAVSVARGVGQRRQVDLLGQTPARQSGGAHRVEVAESAVGFFEVGLEQEGDVAVGPVTLVDLGGEHGEPLRRPDPAIAPGPWRAWARPPRRRPATTRPSSRPSWARRSSLATSRTSEGRRTEWSRRMPSSHTGYHTASATRPMSRRPRWTSTTSRSL